jgi:hypothetical protein
MITELFVPATDRNAAIIASRYGSLTPDALVALREGQDPSPYFAPDETGVMPAKYHDGVIVTPTSGTRIAVHDGVCGRRFWVRFARPSINMAEAIAFACLGARIFASDEELSEIQFFRELRQIRKLDKAADEAFAAEQRVRPDWTVDCTPELTAARSAASKAANKLRRSWGLEPCHWED